MLKNTSVCSGDVLGLWMTSGFAGASGVELGFFSFGSIRSASALHFGYFYSRRMGRTRATILIFSPLQKLQPASQMLNNIVH
jgi:hypothetical protein